MTMRIGTKNLEIKRAYMNKNDLLKQLENYIKCGDTSSYSQICQSHPDCKGRPYDDYGSADEMLIDAYGYLLGYLLEYKNLLEPSD